MRNRTTIALNAPQNLKVGKGNMCLRLNGVYDTKHHSKAFLLFVFSWALDSFLQFCALLTIFFFDVHFILLYVRAFMDIEYFYPSQHTSSMISLLISRPATTNYMIFFLVF